jgi:predicted Zn finger-like uncharacterized protein
VKFLCDQCKAKYQIADEKAAGKTVRMKCRKCGHLIEVRAAVTESSVASIPPPPGTAGPAGTAAGATGAAGAALQAPRAAQKPVPPRAAPLATSLAAAKPAARPEKSGALAGAFKRDVQRDDEVSSPIDMSDLSPSDEWYVAINGVPVGPIRIAEIRRKAALGGVTEDSLAWQEGLDEWRPVRSFPELAAIVREAFASNRASLAPAPPPGRSSSLPPPPRATPARPNMAPPAARVPPRSPTPVIAPAAAAARSNVVPITSRLATAERLEGALEPAPAPPGTAPISEPQAVVAAVVADPFASPPVAQAAPAIVAAAVAPAAAPAVAPAASLATPIPLATDLRGRRQPPWGAIALIVGAVAFGITVAIIMFLPRTPPPTAPVAVQVPAAPTTAAPALSAAAPSAPETAEPTPTAAPTAKRPANNASAAPKEPPQAVASAAPPARGPLDLHGLTGQSTVSPTDDTGGDSPKAPGQCFSQGQVQQVMSLHQTAIQRSCWERNPSNRSAVKVSISLTIEPDGSTQAVSASSEEASVARCVENDVRGWRFPSMGCSQKVGFSYNFVRQ